jgi:oligopeptide transport system substrate-binding protein
LDLCAFPTQAAVHRATIEKHGERWLKAQPLPVSGPYELVKWRLNDRIRLKKNLNYWDAENTVISSVDLFPVSSQSTALNLFANGGVDVVWDKDVVPTELIDVLSKRKDFHRFNYLGTYFLRFNVTREPFDDVRVRKALALAVDHDQIQQIMLGSVTATNIYVPPLKGYKSADGLKRDPALARQLLKEAGYEGGKDFPRVEYLFNTSRDHEKIAVQLQAMWQKELGIRIELRAVEWKVYLNAQSKKDYDISRSAWVGDYADPNTFLDLFMANNPNNRTGWKSDRYDELMRTANATVDRTARAKLLQEAEAILIQEELPIVPIYIYVGFNFFDPEVIKGIYNEENIRDEHPIRAIRKVSRKN